MLSSPWNAGVVALASGLDTDACTGPNRLCTGSETYQVREAGRCFRSQYVSFSVRGGPGTGREPGVRRVLQAAAPVAPRDQKPVAGLAA